MWKVRHGHQPQCQQQMWGRLTVPGFEVGPSRPRRFCSHVSQEVVLNQKLRGEGKGGRGAQVQRKAAPCRTGRPETSAQSDGQSLL